MKHSGRFEDRTEAGKALAKELAGRKLDPVVLALPRGGVPVAVEIARASKAPLDLVLVRKIGVPFQRELAAAAVVDGGEPEVVINDEVVALAGVTQDHIAEQTQIELDEIERRRRVWSSAAGTLSRGGLSGLPENRSSMDTSAPSLALQYSIASSQRPRKKT